MKETAAPSSMVAATPVRSSPKSQEQQVTAAPPAPSMTETNGSNANANELGNNQETEGAVPLFRHYYFFLNLLAFGFCTLSELN